MTIPLPNLSLLALTGPLRPSFIRPQTGTIVVATIALIGVAAASAEEGGKSHFSLFDPTPEKQLREFNPDRPGQSHDPTTIDAGHVAVEFGAFEHVFDPRGPGNTTTRRYIYANPAVRLGLTSSLEVQVATPLANLYRTSGVDVGRGRGVGDTLLGLKANLLGNDGGDHVLALLPTVKVPTAPRTIGNGYAEFSFAIPYNYNLTKDLALTLEPSFSALRNSANTRYRDGFGFIAGLDQTIGKVIIASIEIGTQTSTARKEPTNWSLSPSIAFFLTKNLQLDAGVTFGLNKATPRYDPAIGLSTRF